MTNLEENCWKKWRVVSLSKLECANYIHKVFLFSTSFSTY